MKLVLDKSFYPLEAIDEAVRQFAHLATFTVVSGRGKTAVEVADVDPGIGKGELVDEFLNFVLGTAVSNRK